MARVTLSKEEVGSMRAFPRGSLGLIVLVACSGPTDHRPATDALVALDITPQCLPGCTEEDPNPSAPGVLQRSYASGLSR